MSTFISYYFPLLSGLFAGFSLGFIGAKSRFCLLGAISDRLVMSQNDRLLFWFIASLSALSSTSLARFLNIVDLSETDYLIQPVTFFPAAVGGAIFGIGMVLATGCATKNLIRLGSGSLKSATVLMFVLFAARSTMSGQLAIIKEYLSSLITLPIAAQPVSTELLLAISTAITVILLWHVRKRSQQPLSYWLSAIALGLIITFGWITTDLVAYTLQGSSSLFFFFPESATIPESLSFVQSIVWWSDWLLLAKPMDRFAVMAFFGIVLGAAFFYWRTKTFIVTGFHDTKDLGDHILGGILMGIGAIVSGGCSIGHGLTGFSTGSLNALIAITFIILSTIITAKYQQKRCLAS